MGAARRRQQALGSAYGSPPAWAWHYTMGRKLPRILAAGELQDATIKRDNLPPEFYQVWFTTSDRVDPTSCPAYTLRISYRGDLDTFKVMTGGHWRIGIAADHPALITYQQALRQHPAQTLVGRTLRNLDHCGENRKQWRLAQVPVPITGCCIQELVNGQWVDRAMHSLSREQSGPGYGLPSVAEVDVYPDGLRMLQWQGVAA